MNPNQQPAPQQPAPVQPVQPAPLQKPPHSTAEKSLAVIGGIVLLGIIVGLPYAFLKKIGPFSVAGYTEEVFLSKLLIKASDINSSSYSASASFGTYPREAGAEPFAFSENPALKTKYEHDAQRGRDVSSLLGWLDNNGYGTPAKPYPATLLTLKKIADALRPPILIADPNGAPYGYEVTNGGKDFALSVNLETSGAVATVKRYGYSSTTTFVEGNKVTFTKGSYPYEFFDAQPPKPFIAELATELQYLPSDIQVSTKVTAASQWHEGGLADWRFNFNAEGSFGDLTYKVDADALKKSSDYFFRINNIPSLFIGDLAAFKGKWVKVSADSASYAAGSGSSLSSLAKELPDLEKKYKENRVAATELLKKMAELADDAGLVVFKNPPSNETIDGRSLVRYELGLKKEALLPFYQNLYKEFQTNPDLSKYKDMLDADFTAYLESPEYPTDFDYYDRNVSLVLWTDQAGFPALMTVSIRIIPDDKATQLAGKQVNLVFKLSLSDINESVDITAPNDAVLFEDAIKQYEQSPALNDARQKGMDAAIKADLDGIRAQAEVNYDTNKSYGKTVFALGACPSNGTSLFTDPLILKSIQAAGNGDVAKVSCVSKKGTSGNVETYAISAPLVSDPAKSFCIDSTGQAITITGKIKSDSCK